MTNKPREFIAPSKMLRAKVGVDPAALHKQAVERANQALDGLKSDFTEWIDQDLEKLKSAHETVKKNPHNAQYIENLRTCVHDLRGLGTTYGFPMVSRLASSLCKLFEGVAEGQGTLPMALIESHINAIIAAVSEDITSKDDASSVAVAESLEEMVGQHIAGNS